MVTNRLSMVVACLCAALVVTSAFAQTPASPPTPAGHWTGAIETPGQPLAVEIDLKAGSPAWAGAISIPAQNLKGFPLSGIVVDGAAVTFAMANVPGRPTFKGTLSADGATIAGDFTQGPGTLPFKVTRAGEAVLPPPPAKSTTITKELEGKWSGALEAGGQSLRLVLTLTAGADAATGTLTSVDQGGVAIPIATITQAGTHLEFALPSISGAYAGDLKDGKLVGTWTQGAGTLPLEFTRVP